MLRNSGDLLRQLQQCKFDIVLHGHKHKPQFARLELNADGIDPYPLIVVAAGSTAKNDEDPANNTVRQIRIEANGRLTFETIENGQAPDTEDGYREEVTKLKQRAFSRARERTKCISGTNYREIKIDHLGNMSNVFRVERLRLLRGGDPLNGFPLSILVPSHAQKFEELIRPEDDSQHRIKRICWRDRDGTLHPLDRVPNDRDGGCCWIEFSEPLEPTRELSFGVCYRISNSIAMTSWELAERSRLHRSHDPNYEWVGRYISHPTDRLTMHLEFPQELEAVRPMLRCRRHPNYPDFPLTFLPNIAGTS